MKPRIYILSLLISTSALASTLEGNGGDVVVCPGTISLADYYTPKGQAPLAIDMGDRSQSIVERAKIVLGRLSQIATDEKELKVLRSYADRFFDSELGSGEAAIMDVKLVDVPDTGKMMIDRDCAVEQIAVQSTPTLKGEKRYIIDRALWERLSSEHQVGLVVHELLYRRALERVESVGYKIEPRPAKNSVDTRYLNRMLATQLSWTPDASDLARILWGANFTEMRLGPYFLSTKPGTLETDESGRLLKASFSSPSSVSIGDRQAQVLGEALFYANGAIACVNQVYMMGRTGVWVVDLRLDAMSFERSWVSIRFATLTHAGGLFYLYGQLYGTGGTETRPLQCFYEDGSPKAINVIGAPHQQPRSEYIDAKGKRHHLGTIHRHQIPVHRVQFDRDGVVRDVKYFSDAGGGWLHTKTLSIRIEQE